MPDHIIYITCRWSVEILLLSTMHYSSYITILKTLIALWYAPGVVNLWLHHYNVVVIKVKSLLLTDWQGNAKNAGCLVRVSVDAHRKVKLWAPISLDMTTYRNVNRHWQILEISKWSNTNKQQQIPCFKGSLDHFIRLRFYSWSIWALIEKSHQHKQQKFLVHLVVDICSLVNQFTLHRQTRPT